MIKVINDTDNNGIADTANKELFSLKNVKVKLINYEENKEMLQSLPHRKYLDLAIIPCIVLKERKGISTISNDVLEVIDISAKDIIDIGIKNSISSEKYCHINLAEYIIESIGNEGVEIEPIEQYILFTEDKMLGGAALLSPKLIGEYAEIIAPGHNFYILPSSIHELLLVPDEDNSRSLVDEYKEIVIGVNQKEVDEKDKMSDNVYYYNVLTGTIEIA